MARSGWMIIVAAALMAARCGGSGAASPTASSVDTAAPTVASGNTPALYAEFYGAAVSVEGDEVVLRATSVPDHPSPYFETGHALYEAASAGMRANPNRIRTQ